MVSGNGSGEQVIALTGVSGLLAQRLLPLLDANPAVDRIVGLDVRDPARLARKLEFQRVDVLSTDLAPYLRGVHTVVHLALSLDPLSPIMNTNYATTLMDAHRYPEALAQFQKTLEGDPTFRPAHHKLAHLYAASGDFANAVSELKKFAPTPGAWTGDAKGFRDLALNAFNKPEQSTWVALAFSVTGERTRALDYLEKAVSSKEIEVILCIRYPSFDPIRSDPRFKALVGRLELPE